MSAPEQQQQQAEHNAEGQPGIKLNITLHGKLLLPLEIAGTDTLLEIKQFLSDSSVLYFFTNYHFALNDKPLNEYVDIASLGLTTDSTIDIKLDPFDQRSAKQHVKKVQEVLETPAILAGIFEKFQDGEAGEDQKGKKNKTANQKKESSDDDEQDELSNAEQQKQQQANGKNNLKNGQNPSTQKTNSSLNGDNNTSSREVCQLEDAILASLGNRLIQTELNTEQSSITECVCYLNYSGYNPPPQYRAIQGDLFYLSIKTLENVSYQVTACPKGFYVNKSTAKSFDPSYANKANTFVNLIQLLKSISPLFKQKYEEITNGTNNNSKGSSQVGSNPTDSLNLPVLSFYKYGHRWLHAKSNPDEHEWNMNRCESSLLNLYGFDVNGPRDWNEELQICRDLPHGDFIERLNRDKANIKVQSEFVEAATEGAKAVIDHNIASLNPMDPVHQQVFVYNQIFFSYALENIDHFKQETGPDASPNVTTANCDLRNLRILHKLDIPGLSVLNTCLVDYKGQRVIAQSIIPGILNSDHSNCSQYGSIDDGKTIHSNEEFAEMMKAICDYFQLDDAVQFTDEQSTVHTLCGSIEVKGIRGSDRRKYILDLMRLSPRDMNYPGVSDNLCCTLRHELIANYALAKNFQAATKNIKEQEEKEEKKDNKDEKEGVTNTQEDKNKQGLAKFIKIQEYLQDPEHQIKLKLNPNISTKAPLVELPKLKDQHMQLTEISDYLLNKAIPNVINDLITNSENGRISDSSSIEEYFHAHGVNMRYLGKVAGLINKKETPHIYMIVERVILVKAMKHVFREIMRETSEQSYLQQAIAHGLNAVFGSEEIRRKMENGEIDGQEQRQDQNGGNGNNNSNNNTNESKKKRNKGKKGKKIENDKDIETEKVQEQQSQDSQLIEVISIPEPATISTKPSAIWARIVYVANKRYSHVFPENIEKYTPLTLKFNRLATLRDLLLSIGVHIEAKEYDFSQEIGEKKGLNVQQNNSNNNTKDNNNNTKNVNNSNNNSNGVNETQTPGSTTNNSTSSAVLPFQAADIKDITPIVKFIEIVSDDARANIEMGQKYLMEGKVAESLECYQTSANILVNLYGPVHKEHGYCCHKISNVHFKLGEYETAIYYQKQAIAIYKKLYGLDHHATAQAIATLAYYYFTVKKPQRAYKHMLKALFVYSLIGGEPHPDCFHMFMNLSLMFQENEQHQASLSCLFEALDRSITVYGKDHMKIAGCYQAVALAHYDIDDIKKALEYQQNCVRILKLNLENDDPRIKEALLFQSKFEKTLADKKKGQQVVKSIPEVSENGRSFGTNKSTKSKIEEHQQQGQATVIAEQNVQNPNNDLDNEREILKMKMKYAKMNAKYGTRRTFGYDYQRTTANQEQDSNVTGNSNAQNVNDDKNQKKQEKSQK